VLFDVKFLIEFMRSASWAWTTEACDSLLRHLGLEQTSTSSGKSTFQARTRLSCDLYSGPGDEGPWRMEFPFAVPLAGPSATDGVARFVEMIEHPLRTALGESTSHRNQTADGLPGRVYWSLPNGRIGIEARVAELTSGATVVLQVERADPSARESRRRQSPTARR
jgi:hypothetical protein